MTSQFKIKGRLLVVGTVEHPTRGLDAEPVSDGPNHPQESSGEPGGRPWSRGRGSLSWSSDW